MDQHQKMEKPVRNEQLDSSDFSFRFYQVMGYPIPRLRKYFQYSKNWFSRMKTDDSSYFEEGIKDQAFSWDEKGDLIQDFLAFIKKWWWLYSNFPFVDQIFLANSLCFNALKARSDIDFFVVTQKWRIWTARFFMSVLMWCFAIKRTKKRQFKRFCLSFFVDADHLCLEHLLLDEQDVYLPYWIAHLVPLYQRERSERFFQVNSRIRRFLPNAPLKQAIFLGKLKGFEGKGRFRRFIECIFMGKLWDLLEKLIKLIWLPRIQILREKNPDLHHGVLVQDGILKFHYDKRKIYSDLFFSDKS